MISIVNLKCDPIMTGSLLAEEGIYPAWHMNKANWVSAAIDDRTDKERLELLIDISFDLTAAKSAKKRITD